MICTETIESVSFSSLSKQTFVYLCLKCLRATATPCLFSPNLRNCLDRQMHFGSELRKPTKSAFKANSLITDLCKN